MCGINGIFGTDYIEGASERIADMNRALAHRGPDDNGLFADDTVALGHQRLAIIDLSKDAAQPMYSPDKRYVLVFNGEVYNFQTLKTQIGNGYDFKTNSDSEVVLAAYLKWGKQCVNHFNGMFAFAIWDQVEKTLFIARDRMGIKPLYYYRTEQALVFSSELRSLLASELVPRKLDHMALQEYLRYQTVHAPDTLIEGVRLMQPGTYFFIQDNEFEHEVYWDVTTSKPEGSPYENKTQITDRIHDLLQFSVQQRMVADVPFGAFLSGGIDSSILVALMSEVAQEQVKTFHVSFAEEAYSEAKYARMIAEKFDTNHHEITLSPQDLLDDLPDALAAMDFPSGDGINTYTVSKATKAAGITMAFSGVGGDELFAGYPVFKHIKSLEEKRWLLTFPRAWRRMLGEFYKAYQPGARSAKMAYIINREKWDIEDVYPAFRLMMNDRELGKMVGKNKVVHNQVENLLMNAMAYGLPGYAQPSLSRTSCAEMLTYMQHILLRDTDQMSMAHALEVRVPFLDHHLVSYVLGVPDKYKYPDYPKKLLIESFKGVLPDELVHREKMGFVFPWKEWMRGDLHDFAEEHLIAFASREYVNGKILLRKWEAFKQKKHDNWSQFWYLIVLENWLSRHRIV